MTTLPLKLIHLTFIGLGVDPASVEFGPAMTLVRGPSDTGKSFIVDSLDFMLGANALKEIPESEKYSTVLLGLQMPNGELVTLARSVKGGSFNLHLGDIRQGPLPALGKTLTAKHNAASETNISRYLLNAIGLDGRRVRKNIRNATDSLSFRNVANLCVVDETRMQAATAPAQTGNYVTKTKEASVLKMFLQDADDSDLIEVESTSERAKLSGAKIDVVDRLLRELEARLADAPEASELRAQLGRLSRAIEAQSGSISSLVNSRNQMSSGLREQQNRLSDVRSEWAESGVLRSRFDILLQKYESDIARLATIREAGNLLGYFTAGVCAFCGAEPEHQHNNTDCEGDTNSFGSSIDEQVRRTRALADDLQAAMSDLDQRRIELRREASASAEHSRRLASELAAVEQTLASNNVVFRDVVDKRASVERALTLYDQIESLEKMKLIVVDEATAETAAVAASLSLRAQREFSNELVERLRAWGFPNPSQVRYDASVQDIVAGDQLRSAHGKGVRAILHGAFTVGLAKYCVDREMPHPGFVVLDSPLVTYRPPDQAEMEESEEGQPPEDVVAAFYRDLQEQNTGQVIVMENTDPPKSLDERTVDIVFTASDHGRYGFFPLTKSREGGATAVVPPTL